jgi:hypothetical protein
MARSSSTLATVVIVVLVLALLYALNPSTDDFQAWRTAQAQSQAGGSSKTFGGVLKKAAGAIAGAMTGVVAGGYKRKNYFVFSTYSLSSDLYLGVAKIFIQLK